LCQSDTARATYLKWVYGVDEESPTDYDVVINTEQLTPDAAVALILGLVQARPAPSPPTAAPVRASGG
jgi:cytidylate kinase